MPSTKSQKGTLIVYRELWKLLESPATSSHDANQAFTSLLIRIPQEKLGQLVITTHRNHPVLMRSLIEDLPHLKKYLPSDS